MKVSRIKLGVGLLTCSLLLSSCQLGGERSDYQHAHISGPTGSGWYPLSTLFSDIWLDEIDELQVTVVEGGAIGNIREVNTARDVQSGFAFASDFIDALNGRGAFEGEPQENVRALGAFYPTMWNFAVLENSPYESLDDVLMHGADAINGNPGDASEATFRRVFEAMGYDHEVLEEEHDVAISYGGYGDAANQLRDGLIDLTVQGGGPGVPALTEVDAMRPLRLLEIPDEALEALEEGGYGYSTDLSIPAGTYSNQTEDVNTVASWAMMVVNKDMNEDLVYEMTKQIWEHVERVQEEQPSRGAWFDPEMAVSVIDDPEENFHPGALRYYEEVGAFEGGSES